MNLKKYDIILLKKTKNLLGFTIKKVLDSPYYHSELYLGENMFLTTAWASGVKIKLLDNNLDDFDVYRYKGLLTSSQLDIIEEYVQKSINTRYDFLESLGLAFKKKWGDAKKYNCITLTANAFCRAGIDICEGNKVYDNFELITKNEYFYKVTKY